MIAYASIFGWFSWLIFGGGIAPQTEGRAGFLWMFAPILIGIVLLVWQKIFTYTLKRKYRITGEDGAVQNAVQFLRERCPEGEDWRDYCKKRISYISFNYLDGICRKLTIEPRKLKVDIRKAKGGGSTFIGTGSGGMVATGVALSVISGLAAKAKNNAINACIEKIEELLYFNNIAEYFNQR